MADKKSFPKVLKVGGEVSVLQYCSKNEEVDDEVVLVNHSEVVEIMRKVSQGKVVIIVKICIYRIGA